jgi:hypothetical protein
VKIKSVDSSSSLGVDGVSADRTTEASKSLLSTIYMYTARPIIQAPSTVYEWSRNRIMGSPPAIGSTTGINPSSTRPFDEEAEALQQELREAVRAREVLPASVLNNVVLDEYNPVQLAGKQGKQTKPAQILSQVLLDQTKELTSLMTPSVATDFASTRGTVNKPTIPTDPKKPSPAIDFSSLTAGFLRSTDVPSSSGNGMSDGAVIDPELDRCGATCLND